MDSEDESQSNLEASKNVPRPEKGVFSYSAKDRSYMLFGLRIAGDFGVTIAMPIVIFVLIGRWFDKTYEKGPWLTILAFVLASILSGIMIYRKAKRYGREYEDIGKKGE